MTRVEASNPIIGPPMNAEPFEYYKEY